MIAKENQERICPFWSLKKQTCRIVTGGLFIPLDDHIEMYCRNVEYPLCLQFNLEKKTSEDEVKPHKRKKSNNRRRYPRVRSNHRITLVRLSDSGNVVCHHPSKANIIDLSSGGMCLKLREQLMYDSVIQFHFTKSFPSTLKSGLAKVKWCVPINNDLRYQVGVAFQNDQDMEAINQYLESRIQ
jgi:hypothetical protein